MQGRALLGLGEAQHLLLPLFPVLPQFLQRLAMEGRVEGGEGPQEAALEKVLLIVEGVELLLGLCAGGVQPLGEFAADAAQGLQLGLDRPGR